MSEPEPSHAPKQETTQKPTTMKSSVNKPIEKETTTKETTTPIVSPVNAAVAQSMESGATSGGSTQATPVAFSEADHPLPHGYGCDRIAALVRDPQCIFVYWDLTGDTFNTLVSSHGETYINACHWALRLNNHADSSYCLVAVPVEGGNWYLEVMPDTGYSVDIGLMGSDGTYRVVATSNRVTTPRDSISDRIDEEWVVTEEEYEQMFELSGGNRTAGDSISSVGMLKVRERIAMQLKQSVSSPPRR